MPRTMLRYLPAWRQDAPYRTRRAAPRLSPRSGPRRPASPAPAELVLSQQDGLSPALREALWAGILGLSLAWSLAEAAAWLAG